MTKFQRGAVWGAFSVFGLIVLVALVGRVGAGWYLSSDRFRSQITGAVGRELKADGTFMPLHFVDGTFYSDGFVARGKKQAFFSDLRADQIRAVLNWRGLLDRRWEVDELNIQNLDVRFADHSAPEAPTVQPGPGRKKNEGAWKLDLRKADVAESSWHWGASEATSGSITKSAFTLTPNQGAWLIEATSGTLAQTGWPSLTIELAKLRYAGASLFVTESVLRAGDGRIAVNGEVDFDRAADLQATLDQVDLTPLLPTDWRVRLHGKLAGTTKVHAPLPSGDIRIEGDLRLGDGQLEALPLLDQIAAFTRTEQFRRVTLTRGSLSFMSTVGLVRVTNLLLESEGLMRVEGGCTIANGRIDGAFQVGVTAASLQWLPGSQARVFTVARDGYFWTPVHLTGPVAHPREDLTRRLVAAAAGELLQNPQDALQDAAKSLLDLIPH